MTHFDKQFCKAVINCRPLPLVHLADAFSIRNIQLEKKLRAVEKCENFNEHILYFFYGKPAYRTKDFPFVDLGFDLPIVFVMKHGDIGALPSRAFPFDTGAFFEKLYRGYFHKKSPVENFEMSADESNILRFITSVYGNEYNYKEGNVDPTISFEMLDFEINGVVKLARNIGMKAHGTDIIIDERARSVEVHIQSEVELENNVEIMIYPSMFLGNLAFLEFTAAIKPNHTRHYNTLNGVGGEGYSVKISTMVEDAMLQVTQTP